MRRSRAYLSISLALILALASAVPAFAVTRAEAEAHAKKAADARKRAAEQEQQAKRLKAETAELDKRIDKLQAEAAALKPAIDEATTKTERLHREVVKLDTEVNALQAQIEKTQAEYDVQQALLAERVQAAYKQGTWYYFDIVLGASDFNDLIARTELVNRVIESNNNIAANLHSTKETLSASKVKLQRSLDDVKLKRKEAEQVENRLRGLQNARKAKAAETKSAHDKKSALMVASEKDAARWRAIAAEEAAESARIERELSGRSSGGSGQFAGTMAWPVPGFTRISSPFGWRTHPIFGNRRFHAGIDIASSGGRSINGAATVSTGDGTVIYTGYRGGYGNTVMIDHGDGVVTLYAHLQSGSISVGNGQRVSKGDKIGRVGSTGYSTGPHLHFEVRVNGTPRNPMNYL